MDLNRRNERILDDLTTQLNYKYKDMTKRDVCQALGHFNELRPINKQISYPENGRLRNLIALTGTIPVKYKNSATYNIPIEIILSDTHPYTVPLCYVRPTSDMKINVSDTVDARGLITIPSLKEWKYPQSDTSVILIFNILYHYFFDFKN
jgi:ESCRT-I complex subunit TSG101